MISVWRFHFFDLHILRVVFLVSVVPESRVVLAFFAGILFWELQENTLFRL